MKSLVGLEVFIDPVIDQLFDRFDREIDMAEVRSAEPQILLSDLMSFWAADAVAELSVSTAP